MKKADPSTLAPGIQGVIKDITIRSCMEKLDIVTYQPGIGVVVLNAGGRPLPMHIKDVDFVLKDRTPACPCCGRALTEDQ